MGGGGAMGIRCMGRVAEVVRGPGKNEVGRSVENGVAIGRCTRLWEGAVCKRLSRRREWGGGRGTLVDGWTLMNTRESQESSQRDQTRAKTSAQRSTQNLFSKH